MSNRVISTTEVRLLAEDGTAFDAVPLPAGGAKVRSEIVQLEPTYESRDYFGLWLRYTCAAIGGAPHLRVRVSGKREAPAYDDDSWANAGVTDGVVTGATAFAGGTAVNGQVIIQADLVKLVPSTNVAVQEPIVVPIRLGVARWLFVEAAEIGITATPGTLRLGVSCC